MNKYIINQNKPVILYEEAAKLGGFGSSVIEYLVENQLPTNQIHLMGIEDIFVNHGSKNEILKELNLDITSIIRMIRNLIS